jgi:phosphoribosylformylglycinamidine synthase
MLGALRDAATAVRSDFSADGDAILLLGATDEGDFGGSDYARIVHGTVGGLPPRLDLGREKALQGLLASAAADGLLRSAHDPSGGGLAVALAESAIHGGRGFTVTLPEGEAHLVLFSESPARAVVSCAPEDVDEIERRSAAAGVEVFALGTTGGDRLDYGAFAVSINSAKQTYEEGLPKLMSTSTLGQS